MNNKEQISKQIAEINVLIKDLYQQMGIIKEKALNLESELQVALHDQYEETPRTRKTRTTVTQKEIATVIGLYKNNADMEAITRVANLSLPTVNRILACYRQAEGGYVSVDFYQNWRADKYDK